MSSTRTLSAPRSTMSRMAAQLSAARVSLFLRSRSPMRPPYRKVRVPQRCVARKFMAPAMVASHRGGSSIVVPPDTARRAAGTHHDADDGQRAYGLRERDPAAGVSRRTGRRPAGAVHPRQLLLG